MIKPALVRIDGIKARLRFDQNHGVDLSVPKPISVSLEDRRSSNHYTCEGSVDSVNGELIVPLPASLLDGSYHQVDAKCPLWEGSINFNVDVWNEYGRLAEVDSVSDTPPSRKIVGRVEYFDGEAVRGWAFDPNEMSDRVKVDIFVDNRLVAHALADERRQDLVRAQIGDGRCGFFKNLPSFVLDGERHVIACVVGEDRDLLEDGLVTVIPADVRAFVVKEIVWRINRIEALLEGDST